LTNKTISNKLAAMNGNLDSLEQKIEQVLALCGQLRNDNRALREQLTQSELKGQSLASRADAARVRLEALMEKLPAE
jgi:cell division protein ZapB